LPVKKKKVPATFIFHWYAATPYHV